MTWAYHGASPGLAALSRTASRRIVSGVLAAVADDINGRVHSLTCGIGTCALLRIRCVPTGVDASSVSRVVYRLTKGMLVDNGKVANVSDRKCGAMSAEDSGKRAET
jgi:hypothetical protein